MCRCSVLSVISSDQMAAFAGRLIFHNNNGVHMSPICMLSLVLDFFFFFTMGHFDHIHCTLSEEKEDEPNSGVQRCSAVFKIMQNVSTLQEFTACCLSRLDGGYTMTFN